MSKLKAVTLSPYTVHCVKTGTALASIVGDGSEAVIRINGLLANGTIEAGNHPGHVKMSPATIEAVKTRNGVKLASYRWLTKPNGVWIQHEGWHIGEHNIAVLRAAGINPDPTTLSAGQKNRRTYGHQFQERIPKAPKAATVAAAPMGLDELLSAAPIVSAPVVTAVPTPPIAYTGPSNALELAPSHAELTYDGRGGYAKYKSRAVRGGWTAQQATQAWNEGRAPVRGPKVQATPIVAVPVPLPVVALPVAVPVAAPKVSAVGGTIQVSPQALKATLAALEGATIGHFDGVTFTVSMPA